MRAAQITDFGPPDTVKVDDAPAPLVGPDSVLVDVAAAGVNPVDWKVLEGHLQGAFPHHLPLTPGWDVAGVVTSVGPAVTSVAVGDKVAAYARKDHVQNGTFAEQVAVPERAVARVPEGVELAVAGAVPLAGLTALQLLDRLEVRDGDTVLVHAAAGGVGSFAVQLATLRGATVIGTASARNHDYLRRLGAEPVEYGDGLADRVRKVAPGGVDVVVDLVGGDAIEASRELLVEGGRIGSIIDPAAMEQVDGAYVFVRPDADGLAQLLQLVADGALDVEIAETFPLEEAGQALARNKEGHVRGKVVVTV